MVPASSGEPSPAPSSDADLLVVTGDPSDPRTSVVRVFLEGRVVYDSETEGRRF